MSRQENSSTHSEALALVNKLQLLSYELTTCSVVLFCFFFPVILMAQTSITAFTGNICRGGSQDFPVCFIPLAAGHR